MFQFRRFPAYAYLIQRTLTEYCSAGFPHSEILGYNAYVRLPQAYRSLSRPSSAPDAKAFPLRSFQLDLPARSCAPWSENLGSLRIMQASTEVLAWLIVLPNFSSYTTCFALCCLLSYFILHCSVFKVLTSNLFQGQIETSVSRCFDLILNWWR